MSSVNLLFLCFIFLQFTAPVTCNPFVKTEMRENVAVEDKGGVVYDMMTRFQTSNRRSKQVRTTGCPCGTCKHLSLNRCCACGCTCGQYYLWWPDRMTCQPCCRVGRKNKVCSAFESVCCCGCFQSTSSVTLENGESVTMSELQVGDRVQTATGDGRIFYSEVRVFLRRRDTLVNIFKSITTSGNTTITLTGNHLIYSKHYSNGRFDIIYGDQVAPGYDILVQRDNELTSEKVINVSSLAMQGAYVPVTMEGNIIVDGVLASCYASSDHGVAHFVMAPIRKFPEMMKWIFGKEDGSQAYVNILKGFKKLVKSFQWTN